MITRDTYVEGEEEGTGRGRYFRKAKVIYNGKLVTACCGLPLNYFALPAYITVKHKRMYGVVISKMEDDLEGSYYQFNPYPKAEFVNEERPPSTRVKTK